MPLHYMQAMKLPKWVIKHIDRLPRNCLWEGNESCKGINCLVNWHKVCTLRENGGMGIINFQAQNDALLTKCLWKLQNNPECHCVETLRLLYGIQAVPQLGSHSSHSFFLKTLGKLAAFYSCSIAPDNEGTQPVSHWTQHGQFTSESAYALIHRRDMECIYHRALWKLKSPTKDRTFPLLVIQDRILTQQVLNKRGCNIAPECKLCSAM